MTAHTPGPWEVEYDNDGNDHFVQWFAIGPPNDTIARVYITRYNEDEKAQAEANAALIAAAPDLLILLQEAMDSRAPDFASAAHPGWYDRAKVVLKANGAS